MPNDKVERIARLRWVPVAQMHYPRSGQRAKINVARVDRIAASFDPERLGYPTVNERGDGFFYVLDGMHRVEAMKKVGWGDQQIQCQTYEGLTEQEEAETFLKLNDTLAVSAYDRFTKGVNAGRAMETEVNRVVVAQGLRVSTNASVPGSIQAVSALTRVYQRSDSAVLGKTLRIAYLAFGDPGLSSTLIDGLGYLVQRYNADLVEEDVVKILSTTAGGVGALTQKAEVIRRTTGYPLGQCLAAAVVETLNRKRGSKKLADWWKVEKSK